MDPAARDVRSRVADRPQVRGVNLDSETRCAHYRGVLDIIAIKLYCCGEYYACKECHDALADHKLSQWPRDRFGARAVLCGACGAELTIDEYLHCQSRCPDCGSPFNPRCSNHHHYYFAIAEARA